MSHRLELVPCVSQARLGTSSALLSLLRRQGSQLSGSLIVAYFSLRATLCSSLCHCTDSMKAQVGYVDYKYLVLYMPTICERVCTLRVKQNAWVNIYT